MLRNYARVALRNLLENRLHSAINILGLAVGLGASLLIFLLVQSDLGYDSFWSDAERVHRLNLTFQMPGREPLQLVRAQGPARDALVRYFPEIEAAARLNEADVTIENAGTATMESITWADPEIVDIFDFAVVAGDVRRALTDSSSLVVTQGWARRVLGSDDVMGHVVTIAVNAEVRRDFRVAAVLEDLPANTVLDIEAMLAIDPADFTSEPWRFESWFSANNMIFFKLREGERVEHLESRLAAFADANIDVSSTFGPGRTASEFALYSAQPVTQIQLHPAGLGEMKPTGDVKTVILFSSIAILVLAIACINFMNLATARSTLRAREVVLRKVLGASRRQVLVQFLGESMLVALLALLIALALVELTLPSFASFLGKTLVLDYTDLRLAAGLATIVVFVGLVGGTYPAMILSGFRPVQVLKANRSASAEGSSRLRNALVVFQFAVSIALIVAAATVWLQMRFILSLDPGYTRENMLVVHHIERDGVTQHRESLRNEVRAIPGVREVTFSLDAPLRSGENNTIVDLPDVEGEGTIVIGIQNVDLDFLETYQIQLIAGRDFSADLASDALPDDDTIEPGDDVSGSVIVNRAALGRFGYGTPEEALGRAIRILYAGTREEPIFATVNIIGVTQDVHFQSMKTVIRPELYLLSPDGGRFMTVRFEGDPAAMTERVAAVWHASIGLVPFEHEFVEAVLLQEFEEERRRAVVLGGFAVLAIVVACLGLYGLASFTALRRTREIGLRKVLGASVMQVIRLLVWQFSGPVLLANVVAWPLVSWLMLMWLRTFPYRINEILLAPLCVGAGLLALIIAWATIGGNAAQVARSNPIHALRYE